MWHLHNTTDKKNRTITTAFDNDAKLDARLKRKLYNLFFSEKYDELLKELSSYTTEKIESFFEREGGAFLRQAIVFNSAHPLNFLVSNIPWKAVNEVFNNNKIDFLEEFLYLEKIAETKLDRRHRDITTEKFTLFLKIEPEGVQEFMSENASSMTGTMLEDYSTALKVFSEMADKKSLF
jgi:hypothetical protein